MNAIRNFLLVGTTVFGGWLLWRINGAIGDQALLLVFGIVIGLACVVCVAVIGIVIAQVQRDGRPEPTPQLPQVQQFAPPVIVFLPDGRRYDERPYHAPTMLPAPQPMAAYQPKAPRMAVGERQEYVVEEWVTP